MMKIEPREIIIFIMNLHEGMHDVDVCHGQGRE